MQFSSLFLAAACAAVAVAQDPPGWAPPGARIWCNDKAKDVTEYGGQCSSRDMIPSCCSPRRDAIFATPHRHHVLMGDLKSQPEACGGGGHAHCVDPEETPDFD